MALINRVLQALLLPLPGAGPKGAWGRMRCSPCSKAGAAAAGKKGRGLFHCVQKGLFLTTPTASVHCYAFPRRAASSNCPVVDRNEWHEVIYLRRITLRMQVRVEMFRKIGKKRFKYQRRGTKQISLEKDYCKSEIRKAVSNDEQNNYEKTAKENLKREYHN